MELQASLNKEIFPWSKLKILIWPLMFEQLLSVTIGTADTMMVRVAGTLAVSGISLVDPINTLISQVFAALATGGAVVAAQYIGNRDREGASTAARQLLYSVTLMASMLGILALAFNYNILSVIFGEVEAGVMSNARVYFYFSAASYPFLGLYNAGAALFRSVGNSKVSMLTSVAMNILNIIGNYVLTYVLGWGVAGIAASTMAARMLGAGVMLYLLHKTDAPIGVRGLHKFRLLPDMIRRILKIGIPNGLENCMFQGGKLITQSLVASFGTVAIAANAVCNNVMALVYVPGLAVELALVTVVGQCVGADEYGQASKNIKNLLKLGYVITAVIDITLFVLAEQIAGIYNVGPEATKTAALILRCCAVADGLIWMPGFAIPFAMRAAGDVRFTMVATMSSMWLLRVGLSYVLAHTTNLGMASVWVAMGADWVARFFIFLWRFKSNRWHNKKVI